jgi:hypothetical protein
VPIGDSKLPCSDATDFAAHGPEFTMGTQCSATATMIANSSPQDRIAQTGAQIELWVE